MIEQQRVLRTTRQKSSFPIVFGRCLFSGALLADHNDERGPEKRAEKFRPSLLSQTGRTSLKESRDFSGQHHVISRSPLR